MSTAQLGEDKRTYMRLSIMFLSAGLKDAYIQHGQVEADHLLVYYNLGYACFLFVR